jgi:hypothetical protein
MIDKIRNRMHNKVLFHATLDLITKILLLLSWKTRYISLYNQILRNFKQSWCDSIINFVFCEIMKYLIGMQVLTKM